VARAFGDKLTQTQINDVTASVIALSRATGTDGARSASIMASTLAQFGMGAEQASRVADVLTFTANATLNSVDSLGEALKYAGTNAALAGMDIEQTAAILGTLGNLGVQGSDAGTVLKRLLIITGAEAAKLKAIFGVSFLDMNGNVRPLVDTLNDVAAATAGMASGEKLAKFNEAFGLLGISAAVGVGRAGDATRKLEADIRNAAGTAVRQAEFMNAGVGGAMRNLTTAVGNLGNAFASALVPALGDASSGLLGALGTITRFVSANQETARQLAVVAAGLVGVGAAAIAIGSALQGLATIIGVLQKALATLSSGPALFAALSNPAVLGGLAVAAVAIGGIGLALRALWPDFKRTTDEYLKMIGVLAGGAADRGGKPLEARDIAPKLGAQGQARLQGIVAQKKTVIGADLNVPAAFRRVVLDEAEKVKANEILPKAERDRRVFELMQIAAELQSQIESEAAAAKSAQEVAAAGEKTAAAAKERAEAGRQLTDEQQKEIDRIREENKTPQQKLEAEKARLMSLTSDTGNGLSQEEVDAAVKRAEEQTQQEIDAANKKANEERDRMAEQAKAVREQVATPEEKLAARIEELKKLPLDAETMARAVDQAKAAAVDSLTAQAQADRQGISSAGTFGDVMGLGIGPELSDPMQETAANTRRMVDELAAMNLAAGGPANVVGPPVANLAGPIGAEVAAPRAADLQQKIAGGAEAATATATLTASVQTMQQQMVAAIDRTTAAVESTVAVLKEIAGNTADMGGVFV
jgi:TP901 family phage tail tape measure protein